MKRTSWIILGWLGVLTTVQAASFDCAKAASNIEKLICGDNELSKLDETLHKAYRQAIDRSVDKAKATKEQRRWLKDVRNTCTEASCLESAYQGRIGELAVPPEDKDVCFTLFAKLDMVGEQNRKRVCRSEIALLLRKPIAPINIGDKMIFGDKEVSNCEQYLTEIPYGGFWQSRRELVIEAPFMRSCGVLVSLWNARQSKDYYSTVTEALNPKHVPPSFIVHVATGDQADELFALEQAGKTAFEVIENQKVALKKNKLSYNDTSVEVIAAADVDNDGLNDYIVASSYSTGTDSSYSVGYLSPTKYRKASRWIQFDQSNMSMPKIP
jgi:uncharacterized protein YecT (DUF1311 family)